MSFFIGFEDELLKLAETGAELGIPGGGSPFGNKTPSQSALGIPKAGNPVGPTPTQKTLGIPNGGSPFGAKPAAPPISGAPTPTPTPAPAPAGGSRNPGLQAQIENNNRYTAARKNLVGGGGGTTPNAPSGGSSNNATQAPAPAAKPQMAGVPSGSAQGPATVPPTKPGGTQAPPAPDRAQIRKNVDNFISGNGPKLPDRANVDKGRKATSYNDGFDSAAANSKID